MLDITHQLPPEILSKVFSYVAREPLYLYCFSNLPLVCKTFKKLLEMAICVHHDEGCIDDQLELSFSTNIKSTFQHNLVVDFLTLPMLSKIVNSKRLSDVLSGVSQISILDLSNQRLMFQALLKQNINELLNILESIYLKGKIISKIYLCGCFSIGESIQMTNFVKSLITMHRKSTSKNLYIDVSPLFSHNEASNEATEYLSYNMAVTELQAEFEDQGIQIVDWFDLLFNPIESDTEFLERLTSVDPMNIPHVNVKGWTLLHSSILNSYFKSTQYLLSLPQVNVNIFSVASFSNDDTIRIEHDEDEISPILHKTVPTVDFKLKYKGTPLFFALYKLTSNTQSSSSKDGEVVDMLIQRGASVNIVDNYGRSFLLIALSYGFPFDFITHIVENFGQVHQCDNNKNSIFHQIFYSPSLLKDTRKTKKVLDFLFTKDSLLSNQANAPGLLPIQIPFLFSNMKNILNKDCASELVIAIAHFIKCVDVNLGLEASTMYINMAIDDCLTLINESKFSKKKMFVITNKIFIGLLRIKLDISYHIDKTDINQVRNEFMRLDDELGHNVLHRMKKLDCIKSFFKFLELDRVSYYFYINNPDVNGNTILHHLISSSENELQLSNDVDRIVEELFGDVGYRNKEGETPTSLSALNGYYATVHFMLSNQQTAHYSERQIIAHNDNILHILRSNRESASKSSDNKRPCHSINSCIKLIEQQNEMLIQNSRNPKTKSINLALLEEELRGDSYSDDSSTSSRTSSAPSLSLMDVINLSKEKKQSSKKKAQANKRNKKKKSKEKDFALVK
ncbi:ankyrin repeat domain-containing protein [Naegleria gruberi]|uniref:Ankyrin repeat domain-containing protein n=1 Tax=Naegleria gruberi TaxID=5762 RepID=D2VD20_NAEGR|nr:ankyrin repeat domain-containing protein [Naegleria gruberi]EFC45159.1 ankyrin repeat domain-containing protein [Naegleria gruberi]|eukprot:XP_002677903.1 ankyrin repeat domain-containing protein [Naegleria gruberi strain NEG-M]